MNLCIDNGDNHILYIDKNLMINNFNVLRINHQININDNTTHCIIEMIDLFMKKFNNNKFIIVVDFNKMNHDISIMKLKKIFKHVENLYMNNIHKILIFNYTISWKLILDIILTFLSKSTKDKICFKKDIYI